MNELSCVFATSREVGAQIGARGANTSCTRHITATPGSAQTQRIPAATGKPTVNFTDALHSLAPAGAALSAIRMSVPSYTKRAGPAAGKAAGVMSNEGSAT